MNWELLKSKTVLASLVLLALSIARMVAGDVTAIQGVQEAVMSLVPIFIRAAVGDATAAAHEATEAAQEVAQAVGKAAAAPAGKGRGGAFEMPAAGES